MQFKTFISAAAIALVAGLGAASAAEQFDTLSGISPTPMTHPAMAATRGQHIVIILFAGGDCNGRPFEDTTPGYIGALNALTVGAPVFSESVHGH